MTCSSCLSYSRRDGRRTRTLRHPLCLEGAFTVGHCLACGIVDRDRLPQLVGRMFAPDLFSGWVIRTLSTQRPSDSIGHAVTGSSTRFWPALPIKGPEKHPDTDTTAGPILVNGTKHDASDPVRKASKGCLEVWNRLQPFRLKADISF